MKPSIGKVKEAMESSRLKGYLGQEFGMYETKAIRVLLAVASAYVSGELVEIPTKCQGGNCGYGQLCSYCEAKYSGKVARPVEKGKNNGST